MIANASNLEVARYVDILKAVMTENARTDLRVSENMGESSWPNPPPIGFAETSSSQSRGHRLVRKDLYLSI